MPAAITSTTSPTGRSRPLATNTTEATYADANTAHAAACHIAVRHRTALTGSYQRRHASVIAPFNQLPVAVTRTSFAGAALVPSRNRWRANRALAMWLSSTRRSTAGRHVETANAG